jgi:hypothetical protein
VAVAGSGSRGSAAAGSKCGSRRQQQSCSERAPGRERNPAEFKIQIKSKTAPNLISSKHCHTSLQKIEINYHVMWFELRNILCHCSFFKFENDFELNIRELKGVEFLPNFD